MVEGPGLGCMGDNSMDDGLGAHASPWEGQELISPIGTVH